MDTIAVVGASDRAIALLGRLAESRFEVVSVSTSPERVAIELRKRLPAALRASYLADVRFVSDLAELVDCSVVLDAYETADESNRKRALMAIESHMSKGAVLASPTADRECVAASLERPTQFVALSSIDDSPTVLPVDATAPGALFAAERLCADLARKPVRARVDSGSMAAIDAG